MKRALMLLLVITLILVGCAEGNHANDNSNESKREDVSEVSNVKDKECSCSDDITSKTEDEISGFFTTLDVLCEKGENYEIYTNIDENAYIYEVYDNNGEHLDEGFYDFKAPSFKKDGDILILECYPGMSLVNKKFYDVKYGRVSKWYEVVFAQKGELIAYYSSSRENLEQSALVISNVFDSSEYYHEFPMEFSSGSILQSSYLGAEFIENDTKFKITYTNANDEEVTEIIELP